MANAAERSLSGKFGTCLGVLYKKEAVWYKAGRAYFVLDYLKKYSVSRR